MDEGDWKRFQCLIDIQSSIEACSQKKEKSSLVSFVNA